MGELLRRHFVIFAILLIIGLSSAYFLFLRPLFEAPPAQIISILDEKGRQTQEGMTTDQRVEHIRGKVRDARPESPAFDGRSYLYFNGLDEEIPVYNDGTHGDNRAGDDIWYFDVVRVLSNGTNTLAVKVKAADGRTLVKSKEHRIEAVLQLTDAWIQLTWNDSQAHVILSVFGPKGTHSDRNDKNGIPDSQLFSYDIDGYGPQTFVLLNSSIGNYTVKIGCLRADTEASTKAVVSIMTSWGISSAHAHIFEFPVNRNTTQEAEWVVTTLAKGENLPDEDAVMYPKAMLLIFNPIIKSEGGKSLSQLKGWNDPDELTRQVIEDLREVSHGSAQFRIVERIEVDEYPLKADGFHYDDEKYLSGNWHSPDGVDYAEIIHDYRICQKVEAGEIDEVWLWGGPYFGYYESTMVGDGAYWVNSPPVQGVKCSKLFIIMGFNYERGVGEMLEDFGHRTESMMAHIFGGWEADEENAWDRFTLYDEVAPGRSNCGNIHFAPNSQSDYDWGNARYVDSYCDDWYTYPNLPGNKRRVNKSEWGGGDIRLHHKWWFSHVPHAPGEVDGKLNNWWKYVILYNKYRQ